MGELKTIKVKKDLHLYIWGKKKYDRETMDEVLRRLTRFGREK